MVGPHVTCGDALANVLGKSWIARRLGDEVGALRDAPVEPVAIRKWLEIFRAIDSSAFVEAGNAFYLADGAAFREAVIPGVHFTGDATLSMYRGSPLAGDLVIAPRYEGGVIALVATEAGARALGQHELSDVRDLFVEDGLPLATIAGAILRCPSLEDYRGPYSIDIADALATTAIRKLSLFTVEPAVIAHLAGAPLVELHLQTSRLTDEHALAIATLSSLEVVFACNSPLTDRGGSALAKLPKLRWLDLHGTHITDGTLHALAKLPALELLDITSTPVTADGIRALAGARSLTTIGLAWDCPTELVAAVHAINRELVTSDMMESMGAIWQRTPFDML